MSHIRVYLDSELAVYQLNRVYTICNPLLIQMLQIFQLLERYFEFISYHHIPRHLNALADSLDNYVLDWYLAHVWCSFKIHHMYKDHKTNNKYPFMYKHITCTHIFVKKLFIYIYNRYCGKYEAISFQCSQKYETIKFSVHQKVKNMKLQSFLHI